MSEYEDNRFGGLELDENIETLFKVEPPCTPSKSGYGYIGVLLRNKLTDRIQCHICGKWYKSLSSHIFKGHKIDISVYKSEYSLPMTFPLISRSVSARKSEIARSPERLLHLAEIRKDFNKIHTNLQYKKNHKKALKYYFNTEAHDNKRGLCDAQINSRYLIVCDIVGKEASLNDLIKHDHKLWGGIRRRYGKFSKFREIFGYSKVNIRTKNKFTDESIIAIIRKEYQMTGRVPRGSDFKNKNRPVDYPSERTILNIFGSWNRALHMSGFIPNESRNRPGRAPEK